MRQGIRPDQVRLAVVVQQMVDADAAGVMFTANPANGRRDQTVISAAWGMGESVVSGTVTTDDVIVDAATGAAVSRQTADKEVMTVAAENATREQPVAAARRRTPVLDDREAAQLAHDGARIAEYLGAPQDIEWARAGSGFFLSSPGPSRRCLNPRPTFRRPGRCRTRRGCTSGRASWNSCQPIRAEKSLLDLAAWVRGVPALSAAILSEPTTALAESQRTGTPPAGIELRHREVRSAVNFGLAAPGAPNAGGWRRHSGP